MNRVTPRGCKSHLRIVSRNEGPAIPRPANDLSPRLHVLDGVPSNLAAEFPPPSGKEAERIQWECTFRSILAQSADPVSEVAALGLSAIKHLRSVNDEAVHRTEEREDCYRQMEATSPGFVPEGYLTILAHSAKYARHGRRVLKKARRLAAKLSATPAA
jgi:hypothetical protein